MGLLTIGVLAVLYVGSSLLLPLVIALLLNFLLQRVVRALVRLRVPRSAAAALIVVSLVAAVGGGVYSLHEPAAEWLNQAPRSFQILEWKLRELRGAAEQLQDATQQAEKIAGMGEDDSGQQTVVVKGSNLPSALLVNTQVFVLSTLLTFILLYFLLAWGEAFFRRLVAVMPNTDYRRRLLEIAHDVQRSIGIYLGTITMMNGLLAIVTAVAMYLLGMPNPVLWGIMAGLLNFIPYVGAAFTAVVLALVALVTFNDLGHALGVPAVFALITALEGQVVTPTVLGKHFRFNPLVVFVAIVFWGWMWGIAGVFLAVPLLAVIKAFADHSDRGTWIGRLVAL